MSALPASVLDCSGLFWNVRDCSGVFWSVLECSGWSGEVLDVRDDRDVRDVRDVRDCSRVFAILLECSGCSVWSGEVRDVRGSECSSCSRCSGGERANYRGLVCWDLSLFQTSSSCNSATPSSNSPVTMKDSRIIESWSLRSTLSDWWSCLEFPMAKFPGMPGLRIPPEVYARIWGKADRLWRECSCRS